MTYLHSIYIHTLYIDTTKMYLQEVSKHKSSYVLSKPKRLNLLYQLALTLKKLFSDLKEVLYIKCIL